MNEVTNLDLELEPALRRMFTVYGNIPERDPESARHTRDKFLTEINNTMLEPTLPRSIKGSTGQSFTRASWIPSLMRLREAFLRVEKRMTLRVFVTLMLLGAFLFGGAGITVYAASASLPGDAIHPLKTTLENARISLTLDIAAQDRLYLKYAGRRLSEIQSLIEQRRYTDIAYAEIEFERDIQKALGAVESLSKTDPARANALKAENIVILRNYVDLLTQMSASAPADVQSVIQNAIHAAQSAADDEDDALSNDDDAGAGTPDGSDTGDDVGYGVIPSPTRTPTATVTSMPTLTLDPPTLTPFPAGSGASGGNDNTDNDSGGGGGSGDDNGGDDDGGDDDGGGDDDDGDG